ncbi:beta-ketoacyl-ACP synthase III [Arsenicicoccus sp. MKL-02]|uniref:Beta-ketoacyl-[acyl-carrier-protein] synthase III n=1 Tax=Arsenicicoccus cauae TaxID=2663847 RepID=A0A6I3IZV1_9MICO|nr:beta-ketoacyl-ACP synthase III [Arsenicicoccus cauae]MTB72536.1 beta-ketoacyl-ACP synthase III [Arsenicicoccus cauae]
MSGSSIVSVGHYQPERILDNEELSRLVDTSDEWITRRVGIAQRRVAAPDETVADMATNAARDALQDKGIDPAGIDLVIVATCTNHDRSPSTAAQVARRLGLGTTPAVMDVNAVCSGFCHALALADQAIATGSATRAVVVGVDKFTDFIDWSDRTTCILVGDGAGAVVVEASPEPRVSPVVWGSVPDMGDAVVIKELPDGFSQQGQAVFRWTTTELPAIARQICDRAGIAPSELGAIVLHQANLRIIEPLAARIGAVDAVVSTDVVESGNTSAASVPLALSKLVRSGRVPSGAPILLFGFGGGLAYAGQVVRCP